MQKLVHLCVLLAPLAGCALTGAGSDSTGAELPTGVTLLESDQDRCAGVVHVDEASASGGRDVVVRAGENAAFRIEDDEVGWTCVGESTAREDGIDCPDDTSHVRITRPTSGETFLIECFGSEG